MFKKKYLAVAGLMALAVVISGCGKENSGDSVVQRQLRHRRRRQQ